MIPTPQSDTGKPAEDVARQAVALAGRLLVRGFRQQKQVSFKGRGNVVTDTDLKVETRIIELLQKEYPSFSILSEETDPIQRASGYTWIIDPLDGTRNFASDNPFFSVNLGLAYEDQMIMGFTYDPLRKELFHAIKGKGAYLNGAQINISRQKSVEFSVLGFDMGYNEAMARYALEMMVKLWPRMQTVRIMGSAALGLAYVASGRLDLYFHHALAPWDLMSGLLLVTEAGGVVTTGNGDPITFRSETVIASNKPIHADFLEKTDGSDWRVMLRDSLR